MKTLNLQYNNAEMICIYVYILCKKKKLIFSIQILYIWLYCVLFIYSYL